MRTWSETAQDLSGCLGFQIGLHTLVVIQDDDAFFLHAEDLAILSVLVIGFQLCMGMPHNRRLDPILYATRCDYGRRHNTTQFVPSMARDIADAGHIRARRSVMCKYAALSGLSPKSFILYAR